MSVLCGVCPCVLRRPDVLPHENSSLPSPSRILAEPLHRPRDVQRCAFRPSDSFWQSAIQPSFDKASSIAGLFRRSQCEVASEPLTQDTSISQGSDEPAELTFAEELPEATPPPTVIPQAPSRIGVLGAGKMSEALIRGFIASGICAPEDVVASVRSTARWQAMESIGVQPVGDALRGGAAEVAARSDTILLGVKPQMLDGVLDALSPHVTPDHLIVSIVAGVHIASLERHLPEGTRVVRVMPNMPCLIRQAASAFVMGNSTNQQDLQRIIMLLSAVGIATPVEERMMDAITGLSGAAPAYVFLILEALTDGAVAAGLPREQALPLATQTLIGSARMVYEASGDGSLTHPALLKDQITSPAGATMAGLIELENANVRGALIRAVRAAARRSEELG